MSLKFTLVKVSVAAHYARDVLSSRALCVFSIFSDAYRETECTGLLAVKKSSYRISGSDTD